MVVSHLSKKIVQGLDNGVLNKGFSNFCTRFLASNLSANHESYKLLFFKFRIQAILTVRLRYDSNHSFFIIFPSKTYIFCFHKAKIENVVVLPKFVCLLLSKQSFKNRNPEREPFFSKLAKSVTYQIIKKPNVVLNFARRRRRRRRKIGKGKLNIL